MSFVRSAGTIVASEQSSVLRNIGTAVPSAVTLYNGQTVAYEELWARQPNVRTVVDFLARNYAQLTPRAFRRVSDVQREHLQDHQAAQLLRRPNPRTSGNRFAQALIGDLSVFGNFIAVKLRAPNGTPMLVHVPAQGVLPVGGLLEPEGYQLLWVVDQPILPANQVIHLRYYNARDPRWGLSPLETLRVILAEDWAARGYREQFWNNAARHSGVIMRPREAPKMSLDAVARFRADWQATWSGLAGDAGGTPLLEEGMTFERVTFTAQEAEYLSARKLAREECAAAFHIPPAAVGVMDNANIANVEPSHRALYQDTFAPLCDFVDDELGVQLLPDFPDSENVYLEHNLDEKLEGSFSEKADVLSKSVGAPVMTRNEGRAKLNLPPIDGADELITPLNVTTGGRANPADAAPGTPGLGQSGQASRRPFERRRSLPR